MKWGEPWGSPWGAQFKAANLSIRRGDEGPQIVLSWDLIPAETPSEEVLELRLVRKRGDFPQNVTDGKVLLIDDAVSTTSFIDLTAEPLTIWYYALFTKDSTGNFVLNTTNKGRTFTYETGFFQKRLFELLPAVYRELDKGSTQRALLQAADTAADGEIRNLEEDGTIERGELERFLRIFGLILDQTKGLIDFFPNLFDVDETDPDFLAHMSELVGLIPNFDIPITQRREEVKQAVDIYRSKGTASSIEARVRTITGLETFVDEFGDNVLVSNRLDRLSAVLTDAVKESLFGLPGDETMYSLDFSAGGFYGFDKIGIFMVFDKITDTLPSGTLKKVIRELQDFIPAGIVERLIGLDQSGIETKDLTATTKEVFFDVIT